MRIAWTELVSAVWVSIQRRLKFSSPSVRICSHTTPEDPIVLSDDENPSRQCRTRKSLSTAAIQEATLSCLICTNDVPTSSIPPCITAACKHVPQTCRLCIASWISSRLQSSGHESLTCPQCNERLHEADVRLFAASDVYQQYVDLVLRSSLSNNPEFHWCIKPGCHSGQLHADSNPIFRCAQCKLRSCVQHKVPWHDGLTCKEYDARITSHKREMEEVASRRKVKETTRQCPGQNCGWRIEKNDGCDHMTCRKCNTEFCWLCKANYKDIRRQGNVAHRPTCRYNPTNLPRL